MGDPKELKPFALVEALRRTLFDRLEAIGNPVLKLSTQYRMPKVISKFVSDNFYRGAIIDGDFVPEEPRSEFDQLWSQQSPVILCNSNIKGYRKKGEYDAWKRSYDNDGEAEMVIFIALDMLDMGVHPDQIAIMTPFVAQRLTILRKFRDIRKEKRPKILVTNLDAL
eukprot:1004472_1